LFVDAIIGRPNSSTSLEDCDKTTVTLIGFL